MTNGIFGSMIAAPGVDPERAEVFEELLRVKPPVDDETAAANRELYRKLRAPVDYDATHRLARDVLHEKIEDPDLPAIQVIHWLGSSALLHGDEKAYEASVDVLRTRGGIRGKIAALALRSEKFFN